MRRDAKDIEMMSKEGENYIHGAFIMIMFDIDYIHAAAYVLIPCLHTL